MSRDPNLELAILAFDRAIAKMRYIQENGLCVDEFRGHFPVVMFEMRKATHHLRIFNESLRKGDEVLEQTRR
jgi:hypothetical protein